MQKLKDNKGIIAKTYIWWWLNVSRNKWIYSITIPNNEDYKDTIGKIWTLVDLWDKFPKTKFVNNNRTIVQELVKCYNKNRMWQFFSHDWEELPEAEKERRLDRMVKIMDKSFISEDEFKELLDLIPPPKIKELEEWVPWHWGISKRTHRKEIFNRYINKLSITLPPNKVSKEASLLRWKRINRGYINNTDYRSLVHKKVDKIKKPELLILLDWSWSMRGRNEHHRMWYEEALNFIADLSKLWIFDLNIIHTDSYRVTDITDDIAEFAAWRTNILESTSWAEWFESLTDRLWDLPRLEDYVLIITDMEVPSDAEDNLRTFIWQKKHLVLSFWYEQQFENLNVRFVKEYSDMKNVITTLIW